MYSLPKPREKTCRHNWTVEKRPTAQNSIAKVIDEDDGAFAMSVPDIILDLVQRFASHREDYLSPAYNEAQVRREFIDPLFKALGWDIYNEQGFAEPWKQVIHEDAIRSGGSTKAPDYCFRLGGRRLFFLEAKKPSTNILDDPTPAYQLRRYGWTAGLPLSILTNFEHLVIYDTRVQPSAADKASTARILTLHYTELPARWDELAFLFSPEAIQKGAFDKFAESARVKHGTAAVDDAFLAEMEEWRKELATNLALRNPQITQRELNFAVQRTIDRIVFLRICEDRGIEDYGRLQALLNGENTYTRLRELYDRADERYNSGLFHFHVERDRPGPPDTLTPRLIIDDRVLKGIIKRLYYPESPYEFSAIPSEILGQVYERFLGSIVRLTHGHRAVVEQKPEVRKAGGVYYTPTSIVDYIVKHTVGKLLSGKNVGPHGCVTRLRILDPACGSGSFLLGAYQYLLDWHFEQYSRQPAKWSKGRHPAIFQDRRGQWRLTTSERKRILLNNIYGVDVDSQAVEVTKLSLLLKVLEDENAETLERQLGFLHERALPDLAGNIKCGNSLMGPDFFNGHQMDMFTDEDIHRINVFDWDAEFPEIMKDGGFDAVIGNPPYGAVFLPAEKEYLRQRYPQAPPNLDSYFLFILAGLNRLLKPGKHLGFIVPNTWELVFSANAFRKYLLGQVTIDEIVHFCSPVFRQATVDCEIVLLTKRKPVGHSVKVVIRKKDGKEQTHRIAQACWQSPEGQPFSVWLTRTQLALKEKIESQSVRLKDIADVFNGVKPFEIGKGNPPQTTETLREKPFVETRKKNRSFQPLLRGSLIERYCNKWQSNYWISYGEWLAAPRDPAIFEALEKIVCRQTGDRIVATLIPGGFIARDNLHIILMKQGVFLSLKWILGIMNSKLMGFYYEAINPERGEALAQVKKNHVEMLPIKQPDFSTREGKAAHARMISLVDRMLALQKKRLAAHTDPEKVLIQRHIVATDRQIDEFVYELYGLTENEIRMIESAARK